MKNHIYIWTSWLVGPYLLLATFLPSYAQNTDCDNISGIGFFGSEKLTMNLDQVSNIPESDLPFDRWFYLVKTYPKDVVVSSVSLISKIDRKFYFAASRPSSFTLQTQSLCFRVAPPDDKTNIQQIFILVPPLQPNTAHDIVINRQPSAENKEIIFKLFQAVYDHKFSDADSIRNAINRSKRDHYDDYLLDGPPRLQSYYQKYLESIYKERAATTSPDEQQQLKEKLFDIFEKQEYEIAPDTTKALFLNSEYLNRVSTQSFKFDTRTLYKLVPDIGYVYYGFNKDFKGATPYVGIAFNVRSFDSDIPLRRLRQISPGYLKWYDYLSFHLGLTFGSVAKDNYREDLLGSRTLLTGVGIRFSHAVKLNGGVLWYNRLDTNPLIDKRHLRPVPYIGLSLDIRIQKVIGDLSTIFTGASLPFVR